jgi:hypothetical protein
MGQSTARISLVIRLFLGLLLLLRIWGDKYQGGQENYLPLKGADCVAGISMLAGFCASQPYAQWKGERFIEEPRHLRT